MNPRLGISSVLDTSALFRSEEDGCSDVSNSSGVFEIRFRFSHLDNSLL